MSLFFGLQIALSGLRAQQAAMDVTANNIANAGTPGYTRQEAVLEPGVAVNGAWTLNGPGTPKLGSGVEVQTVRRMQTDFIDNQVRMANHTVGNYSSKNDALSQVESLLAEPGDTGISAELNKFWSAWQDLATSPGSTSARSAVVSNGTELSDRINGLYNGLRSIQFQLDDQITANANKINDIAQNIADLNKQIGTDVGGNTQPNDLLDRRDALLSDLSKLVSFQVGGHSGADFMLTVNGKTLVEGTHANGLTVTQDANRWAQITWSDDGSAFNPTSGELYGQMDTRDNVIEGYIDKLNTVASTLVTSVNHIYSRGLTGTGQAAGNFFDPNTDASNIAVTRQLQDSPNNLATSYTGQSGDSALAQDIWSVKGLVLINGQTINDAYTGLVATIGTDSSRAKSGSDTGTLSLQQLTSQKESQSGVSLDEEMVNMIKYQQAYNACARVVTAIDDMVNTLIKNFGVG